MQKCFRVVNSPYFCYYRISMKKTLLAPSLLSADFSNLASALNTIEEKGGSIVHIDVMDGQFVPQITYGQPVIKSIRKCTKLPFDIHLMVYEPEKMVESFAQAGADFITFHYETTAHINSLISKIHSLGKKAGISIVPSTPVSVLTEVLADVDLVLVMTVNPGFGGQKLIPSCVKKISELVRLREENGYSYQISVDGGINNDTIKGVIDAGADIVVSGAAFFNGSLKWEM